MMSEDQCSLDDLLCLQLDNEVVDHNSLSSSHLQTLVSPPTVFDCISCVNQTPVRRETQSYDSIDAVNTSYSSYMSCLLEGYNCFPSSANLCEYETQSISSQLQSNLLHDFSALSDGYCGSSIGVQAFKSKYLADDRDAFCQQIEYPVLTLPNAHTKPVYSLAYSSPTVESDQKSIISPESMEESSGEILLDPESPGADSIKTQIETNSVPVSNGCDIISEEELFRQDRGKQKRQKKVEEPRYAFKTRSDTDILDDGYKWRKYGQKAVKNNSHPRSYYRCTYNKCLVKKRVERHGEDPGVVVTTYQGVHNHRCESNVEMTAYPLIHIFPFRQPPSFGHSDNLLRIHS
eukprot:c26741_g1_i1 orf=391-1431(+)